MRVLLRIIDLVSLVIDIYSRRDQCHRNDTNQSRRQCRDFFKVQLWLLFCPVILPCFFNPLYQAGVVVALRNVLGKHGLLAVQQKSTPVHSRKPRWECAAWIGNRFCCLWEKPRIHLVHPPTPYLRFSDRQLYTTNQYYRNQSRCRRATLIIKNVRWNLGFGLWVEFAGFVKKCLRPSADIYGSFVSLNPPKSRPIN